MTSVINRTDSYKLGHWKMLPEGCTEVMSYAEARGGLGGYTCFFGLTYLLEKYLSQRVHEDDVHVMARQCEEHFGTSDIFNYEGWIHIIDNHQGKLPLEIRAVREGSCVPHGNVLMTIRNTDPECAWLTNYVETMLLKVWYPSTVATLSREMKRIILAGLEKSGSPVDLLYKLHDFGARGVSSEESAELGGMAHLVNFQGSDTFVANIAAQDYYRAEMPSNSVPATEHSVMTIAGRDGEVELVRELIRKFPTGILSVVCDSYDTYNFCRNVVGGELRDEILGRDGVFVVRPDSGANILHMLVNCMEILGEKFGTTTNSKGYKVLNDKVRVLQGDGMDFHSLPGIVDGVIEQGWSLDNIATFGMGGGLLQKVDRDTQGWALKCCSAVVDGERRDVFKHPATDAAKSSKRGRLDLVRDTAGNYATIDRDHEDFSIRPSELETRFINGIVVSSPQFDEIRWRAEL